MATRSGSSGPPAEPPRVGAAAVAAPAIRLRSSTCHSAGKHITCGGWRCAATVKHRNQPIFRGTRSAQMNRITRFVLGHKAMICIARLVLAAVGGATAGTTTKRLATDFSVPDQPSYQTDGKIAALYHNGAGVEAALPVITLSAGQNVDTPGIRAQLETAFASVAQAVPNSRIVDYPSTGDRSLVTTDGRSTFALVFTDRPQFGVADPTTKIKPAIAAVA